MIFSSIIPFCLRIQDVVLARIFIRMGVYKKHGFRCAFLTPGLFTLSTALNKTLVL